MRIFTVTALAFCLSLASVQGEDSTYTEEDLPSLAPDPAGPAEIDEFAQRRGFRYARDTRRAARGDVKALKKFFEIAEAADGAAAESIDGIPAVVCALLGDRKLAQFLATQSVGYRVLVRKVVIGGGRSPEANARFSAEFPESAKLLLPREVVAWTSPNKLYAIRKVFAQPGAPRGAKVERAELIETKTGKVLYDLTADDIGTGADQEGDALWSPDSKAVACLSIDLPEQPGHLFSEPRPPVQRKQTAVYRLVGDVFARVELSLGEAPGQEKDPELKGAVAGHIYTEPVRWQRPGVLILNRHEYYGIIKPRTIEGQTFETIEQLGRTYKIVATIDSTGKGSVQWERQPD